MLKQKNETEIAITDGCQIYVHSVQERRACRTHFKAVRIVHKGKLMRISNNRAEKFNSDLDLFLHVFRGLKSFRTAKIWFQDL